MYTSHGGKKNNSKINSISKKIIHQKIILKITQTLNNNKQSREIIEQ